MRDAELERRVLEFAFTTDEVLSVAALAFFAPCTLDEAERCLTDMAGSGRVRLESDDDGNVFYVLPNRFRAKAAPARAAPLAPTFPSPLAPHPMAIQQIIAAPPVPIPDAPEHPETGDKACPFCGETILAV